MKLNGILKLTATGITAVPSLLLASLDSLSVTTKTVPVGGTLELNHPPSGDFIRRFYRAKYK